MDRIRVLIVDDHAILREGLLLLLASSDDIKVVGEAGDGKEALDKLHQLTPDVVLMDIAMPRMDGLEATRRMCKESPDTKVVILTQHDNKEYIVSSIRAGAAACIPKKAVASDLVSAIRSVYQGDAFLYPPIAKMLIDSYREKVPEERQAYGTLTDREREVLKLIADGHTNQEIASLLVISMKTALNHRARIMEKLHIHNRTELIKYAIREGLASLEA